ncbi:hypothetical protein Tsubulata_025349 [Turnera subulata]|uniref:AP-5 complex subunit beta-1 n=1 Tax=Turnera subulata TaxID=218843 RepID=A0A9Q0FXJ3_9ROSI|nr:hypothetical protein Tsubulata_025349 [Turnera subulata]
MASTAAPSSSLAPPPVAVAGGGGGPPLKVPTTVQEWELLAEEMQQGKWNAPLLIPSLLDHAVASLLRKDSPPNLKLPLLLLLEEFAETFFADENDVVRLVDALRAAVQSPVLDGKDQFMLSATSIVITVDHRASIQQLMELLLTVINRPNHGPDRQTRAAACECLRQLEKSYPCLLSAVAPNLWGLCQSERTHACQSYLLLFTTVVYNVVANEGLVNAASIFSNTALPLVPFNVPHFILSEDPQSQPQPQPIIGSNSKEVRRAMAFLMEAPQILTPCGMVEFLGMIMPLALALELQPSMLKVQFFGMIHSFDPLLSHLVLSLYSHFLDAFDGLEGEIFARLVQISTHTQHYLVFRLLALHWLSGLFTKLILKGSELRKDKSLVKLGLRFYPALFDPLALKALKLDLLAFYSTINMDVLRPEVASTEQVVKRKSVSVLFQDGLLSVSGFKWLPPWSSETSVAFRCFHKFLIGASSHSDSDPSTTKILMDSAIFHTIQEMLVGMTLEFHRLVPVIVYFIGRLLGCQKHLWLGERLLQTVDEWLLPKVKIDYKLVSYFPIFDRIAENSGIPPQRLLNLLIKLMVFLVEQHGPDTELKSWSHGSKVLGICRTMLIHHHSSRLFLGLSRLLSFTCLYFPDLEVRDNARIYLRMLICIPGMKLRAILNLGDQFLGISPSSHSSSFFSVQSPRYAQSTKKSQNISSYIHIERMVPLLVKQSWSLSLSNLGVGSSKPTLVESIVDIEPLVVLSEAEDSSNLPTVSASGTDRTSHVQEPLRVMDSKISEILGILRRHFSCIPDFRHMPGLKVRISCNLRFESESFNHVWGGDSPTGQLDGLDALPAIYGTLLKFSSSAPYGSIPSCHIPFLLGEPTRNDQHSDLTASLDIVPVEDSSADDESFRAPVTIHLEPREPAPGLVDVFIEANAENGQVVRGQLQSITVGIEDMFLKPIVPSDILEDAIAAYNLQLFDALWEACGASSSTGREIFPLRGGKGVAAINGTRSVKLLEVPADSLIRATERHLAPFVVGVVGEPLISLVKDGGIIENVVWKATASDSFADPSSNTAFSRGPLHLTYIDDEDERKEQANLSRNMGCLLVLIFLPPRFHLLFQMEVCDLSTLVRIRTDHWPCLAYVDDYLEALYMA